MWSSKVKASKDANELLSMQLIAENKRITQLMHDYSKAKSMLQELLQWFNAQPVTSAELKSFIQNKSEYKQYLIHEWENEPQARNAVPANSNWSSATSEHLHSIMSKSL